MAALSFSYAPPLSSQCTQYINQDETMIVSNLKETCQKIMSTRGCQISVITTKTKQQSSNTCNNNTTTNNIINCNNIEFNISLTGSTQALMEARGDLLQNCPLETKLLIHIPPTSKLQLLTDRFNQLQKELNTKINVIPEKLNHSSLISDNKVTIEIIGIPSQVEICRVRVLVAIDEIMKSFKTEIVRLPLKLQYLICGRKRAGLLPIIEETATNIYFPSPFTNYNPITNNNSSNNNTIGENEDNQEDLRSVIYITGEPNQVSRVKDMLNKLAIQKAKSMYHKDTALYARKIDWLLLYRRDELRKIMHDNGAYIEFPSIGSGDNRVTVYAENRVNAERTLRALNFQACNIYEACFYFNNRDSAIYDSTGAHSFFDSISNLMNLVSQLSQISGSEVIYKTDPSCIEVLGPERAIRNVYQRLQEMQFLQVFHQYTIFRVESSNDQRDFISGKKNGKINKIMKTSGAKIRFIPFMNDYNFVIEVESTSFTKALDGLTLLQEELPAEISFYVPESYHKRIIGVGGKNIQRIMKKYGVYVKFSNTEEFASLGGYYNNEDNVVARTPMKNQINLDNLRHAVMELIHPKDRDYIVEMIQIPFGYHRDLIHKYQNSFITEELVKKTNTQVVWPDAELANNEVELLGPEAHMSTAYKMMESIVPESYDLHVLQSSAFTDAIQSDLFGEKVVELLRKDFNISVESHLESKRGPFIRLHMTRDKVMTSLKDALKIVIDYLNNQNVSLYENTTVDTLFGMIEKNQLLAHKKSSSSKANTNSLLDSSSLLKYQSQPIISNNTTSSVSMVRSSDDTIYTSPPNSSLHNASTNMTPPQVYQFFNFPNDTASLTNNPLDNNSWMPLNSQMQQPIPSTSTSIQSNGSGENNIRAIFDAPMELTDQERAVLNNYRYQRIPMPPPPTTNFGFPQAMPTTSSTSDIWSTNTPSQIPGSRRSTGFSTASSMTSPPATNRRKAATSYGANTATDAINMMRFNDNNNGVFYPSMGQMTPNATEFNPYSDTSTTSGSLKPNQSMPEPILDTHFNTGNRPSFQQSSNTFHVNQASQAFSQLSLGNYRQPPNTNFIPRNTPSKHDQQQQQQQQFFTNNN
ncbi:uncharacterized protein BX663DRAFT_515164 [Cokeromyces recurvatus]|uniref:uncharacterized protein n=1 Tax=Cokeromyces recurvatus TaxID=90255 RepID=UPI00221EE641|nr:uncharacterized protein BX663DRAFT_515164 [Cokeromyces recurvatus]KAI7901167.1 hypothetical protein BX663DRAFT_515164 [Cokeromyces recurvatus]